ncbi:MAG TPA: hypothetical protein VGE12_11230 [Noviherbaspirillum sp.]
MNLTEEMLETAMRKAVEAGLLPRHACREDRSGHRELIRFVLQGALEKLPCHPDVTMRRKMVQECNAGVQAHDKRAGLGRIPAELAPTGNARSKWRETREQSSSQPLRAQGIQ